MGKKKVSWKTHTTTRCRSYLKLTYIFPVYGSLSVLQIDVPEGMVQKIIYKSYLIIAKIIYANAYVVREFHPWCQKRETFRQEKDQVHVHVPI